MFRCVPAAALAATAFVVAPAQAQLQRHFPQNALRGVIVFTAPPEITLNGQPARLAPGARVLDGNNVIQVPSTLIGSKLTSHYTVDAMGLLRDVWLLRTDELGKQPWPTTPAQAAAWRFDAAAQAWSK